MQQSMATKGNDAVPAAGKADIAGRLIALLGRTLALPPEVTSRMTAGTALFGSLAELDSMAVATVLTAIEDEFAITIDDDDVSAELFASVGSLVEYIDRQTAPQG